MPTRSVHIGGRFTVLGARPSQAMAEYGAQVAAQGFRGGMFTLFDPERPTEDANAVLAEQRRSPRDPNAMLHHCPMCCHSVTAAGCQAEAMDWPTFQAHLRRCYVSNRATKLDITKRKFAGASPAPAAEVVDASQRP